MQVLVNLITNSIILSDSSLKLSLYLINGGSLTVSVAKLNRAAFIVCVLFLN